MQLLPNVLLENILHSNPKQTNQVEVGEPRESY